MSKRFARGKQLISRKKSSSQDAAPSIKPASEKTKLESGIRAIESNPPVKDDRWAADMATLRRAAEELTQRRNSSRVLPRKLPIDGSPPGAAETLGYPSEDDQSIRAFYELNPDRAASLFAVTLREGSPEQRHKIGVALLDSGLVHEAIETLGREKNENSYRSFSLLVLVAKTGQIGPLVSVIENHPNLELRLKLIRLMVSSGEREILEAFRRLAVNRSLPDEVRSAIIEAINQLNGQARETAA